MGLIDTLNRTAATLNRTAAALENKAKEINPPKAVKCPRCGSTDFISTAKGYSKGKGLLGAALIGRTGLAFGTSKNTVCCICRNCSKKWEI